MQTATNPTTGETAVLVGDKWQKADHIAQDKDGNKAYFVGGQWMTADGAQSALPVPQGPTMRQKVQASVPYRALVGATDAARGLAQMVARGGEAVTSLGGALPNPVSEYFKSEGQGLDQEINQREAEIKSAREATTAPTLSSLVTGQKDLGTDWARFAGQVANPLNWYLSKAVPLGVGRPVATLAAKGAVIGGAGGALTPVTSGQENFWTTKALQTGIGAATGAAVTPALTRVAEAVIPRVNAMLSGAVGASEIRGARASLETDQIIAQAMKETNQSIDDLPEAYLRTLRSEVVEALKKGKKLDAATLMRAKDFESVGIVPTKGQVTRDATQFADERNLRGIQGAGRPLMDRFTAQNQKLAELLRPNNPQESFQAGEALAQTLKKADEGMRKQVGGMYAAARAEAGKDAQVPLQGLAQDAAQVVDDFADKVPTAVRRRLESFGVFGGNQTKIYTPDEADKLIKLINDHYGADKATNTALDRLRVAVKKTMTEGAVDDVYAPARAAAAKRFKLQDMVPALEDASVGRTAPDDFVRKYLIQGKANDVKAMAELLRMQSPEVAGEAKKQIAAVLQRAAFGENAAGDKVFSPERFAQTLRNIGTEKLGAFYSPAEIESLKTISRVGAYINSIPTAAPVNSSNSGAAVANLAMKAVPKASALAAVLAPVVNSVKNTRAVNSALTDIGPVVSPNLTPEQARILARLAASGAFGVGTAGAAPLQ